MLKSNKPIPDPMEKLRSANEYQAYLWLIHNAPDHAEGVEAAIDGGMDAEKIFQFMLANTSRLELSMRCRLAARYLARVGE